MLLPVLTLPAWGFELSTTTDVSAQVTGAHYTQDASLPAEFSGPDYQMTGLLSVDWNVRASITSSLDVETRYGLAAISELDQAGQADAVNDSADYRLDDLPTDLDPEFRQRLDRLNLRWYSPFGDYVLGRQAISFGQARIFSPVDVVQPASVTEVNNAYRPGVDALRGTWLLGAVSELDVGYVFGDDQVAFARLKAYLAGMDWELIGLEINGDHQLLSLGTTGAVGTVGWWQETSWLNGPDQEGIRSTVGLDATWFDDLYVFSELHYNGLGQDQSYLNNLTQSWYQLGAVQPWGQWYLSLQGQYPVNVLTQLSAGVTTNLNDGSSLLHTSVAYDASQSLSVQVNALGPVAMDTGLEHEYSLYPFAVELRLDWTF
ncbi:hypothetical protein MED297_18021 [Reinekea sp. MED297]|uniref:Alginate export domain-containing protein n=2 Tax=Reinekea TaxID=230494 RepID=A4BKL2_9GAMM|nr:hypothetical protein MED297_18021 [Reinekea sp. MED297] [Reinekea blandensis MED297]